MAAKAASVLSDREEAMHKPPGFCYYCLYSFLLLLLLVHAPLRLLVMVRFSIFSSQVFFLNQKLWIFFYIHTILPYQTLFQIVLCMSLFVFLSLTTYPLYLTIPPLSSLLPRLFTFFILSTVSTLLYSAFFFTISA